MVIRGSQILARASPVLNFTLLQGQRPCRQQTAAAKKPRSLRRCGALFSSQPARRNWNSLGSLVRGCRAVEQHGTAWAGNFHCSFKARVCAKWYCLTVGERSGVPKSESRKSEQAPMANLARGGSATQRVHRMFLCWTARSNLRGPGGRGCGGTGRRLRPLVERTMGGEIWGVRPGPVQGSANAASE